MGNNQTINSSSSRRGSLTSPLATPESARLSSSIFRKASLNHQSIDYDNFRTPPQDSSSTSDNILLPGNNNVCDTCSQPITTKNHACTDIVYKELVQKVSQEVLLQKLKEIRQELLNGSKLIYQILWETHSIIEYSEDTTMKVQQVTSEAKIPRFSKMIVCPGTQITTKECDSTRVFIIGGQIAGRAS